MTYLIKAYQSAIIDQCQSDTDIKLHTFTDV